VRAEPPRPPRRDRGRDSAERIVPAAPRRRCPYLEQILRETAGPFGMRTRFKADCHVDRRTHIFVGRHPSPPCITEPESCSFYQRARSDEDRTISRYTD
jgi:hypothetical protein